MTVATLVPGELQNLPGLATNTPKIRHEARAVKATLMAPDFPTRWSSVSRDVAFMPSRAASPPAALR